LKQEWNGDETKKECGYIYNEDGTNYYKIRKFNMLKMIKYVDFKVTKEDD
jgi:hypothetical protein